MASAIDVAVHVLNNLSDTSTMKLQKLVFYSQAYHLVRTQQPLFPERIEAWVNGPVVPALYETHKGQSVVSVEDLKIDVPVRSLDENERESVDHVLRTLRSLSGSELSKLTHSEDPWKSARVGLEPFERSNKVIDIVSIRAFYSQPECSNPVFA